MKTVSFVETVFCALYLPPVAHEWGRHDEICIIMFGNSRKIVNISSYCSHFSTIFLKMYCQSFRHVVVLAKLLVILLLVR